MAAVRRVLRTLHIMAAVARLIIKMLHITAAVRHVFNMPLRRGGFWTCPQPAAYYFSCGAGEALHATLLAEIVCKYYKTFEDVGKQACTLCMRPCA